MLAGRSNSELCVLFPPAINPEKYQRDFEQGLTPNQIPYGLEFQPEGWEFTTASAPPGGAFTQLLTRTFKKAFGVDVITALRSRHQLSKAQYVYAHTEPEFLGAALALVLTRAKTTIATGQVVWLFHEFAKGPFLHRLAARLLMRRMDVLFYNARPNYNLGQELFPSVRHVYIPFGVSPRFLQDPNDRPRDLILSVGNDPARDWDALLQAVSDVPLPVRIATGNPLPAPEGVEVRRTANFAELLELYRRARVVLLATKPNAHASGITTMLEAAGAGAPVVATRTGGLDDYASPSEVHFVDPETGAAGLAQALLEELSDDSSLERGLRLRQAFIDRGYDSRSYWARVTDVLDTVRSRPVSSTTAEAAPR